mgnify:CR=1 FL=1
MIKMKDSGVEWIGAIPDTWNTIKLYRLLDNIGSGTTPKGDQYYENGVMPWLNTGDLTDGVINKTNKMVSELALKECSALQIHKAGSIVIAMYGATIGKLGITTIDLVTNQACCVMNPSKDLNKLYLFYLLASAKDYFILSSYGAGQPNISQNTIKNLKVPYCTVKEQEKIANYLDYKCKKIDEIIEKQQSVIEKLKEYKLSVITEAVTNGLNPDVVMKDSGVKWIGKIPLNWNVTSLGALSISMRNGYVGPTRDIFYDEGIPYIQSLHVKDGTISFEKEKYFVSEEWGEKHPKVYEGQLLIVQTGDIGQVGLVSKEMNGYNCHALIIVTVNEEYIMPTFLSYYLRSHVGKELLLDTKTGALLPHLNSGKIKVTPIVCPSIEEQSEIVKFLNQKCWCVNEIISKKEVILGKLHDYKKSLIYEVVTGKKEV